MYYIVVNNDINCRRPRHLDDDLQYIDKIYMYIIGSIKIDI